MYHRLSILAALAILVTTASLAAQSDPCLRRTVAVNVFDNQERMIAGLTRDDFQASLSHEPIKILSVTPGDSPRVVIVLDASELMLDSKSDWIESVESAKQLSGALSNSAQLGLIVFSTQVEKTFPLTNNRQSVLRELVGLEVGRRQLMKGTRKIALWEAMGQALSQLGPLAAGDTLYVISNGWDTGSQFPAAELERYLNWVRVFALVPDPTPSVTTAPAFGDRLLQLAARSGGSGLVFSTESIPDRTGVTSAPMFETILTGHQFADARNRQLLRISSYYRLEIELRRVIENKREWSLKLSGDGRSRGHGIDVAYPKVLWPCERSSAPAKRNP